MGRINWELKKKNRKMRKLEEKGCIIHKGKVIGHQRTAENAQKTMTISR